MHRFLIFIAADEQPDTPEAKAALDRILNERPGAEAVLANSSTGQMPRAGDRPVREYKAERYDPLFPGVHTHSRAGDWVVVGDPEVFDGVAGLSSYDEVILCRCIYSPLPVDENPWMEINRPYPMVTVDSFGGDEAAYADWSESDHGKAVIEREKAQA